MQEKQCLDSDDQLRSVTTQGDWNFIKTISRSLCGGKPQAQT